MEIILKYFPDLTQQQVSQFIALEGLYREWNGKINVISRKDIDGLYEKHVLHSLSIAAFFKFQPGIEIIDLGTGGGFPGIPLAIFFPEVKFHLVDSIAKKLKVVEAVAGNIGLINITTRHTRAEEIKSTSLNDSAGHRKFDFVVSRAVAPLNDLWRWSKPLLKKSREPAPATRLRTPGSGLICLKGGDLTAEIQQSGVHPRIMDIHKIFEEEYFREKFILYTPR